MDNRCIHCGAIIPEGELVCLMCEYRERTSCCKGCTERDVTPEYNCHMHCQRYIKERLKAQLSYKARMRHLNQKYFMHELKAKVKKINEAKKRANVGKANKK